MQDILETKRQPEKLCKLTKASFAGVELRKNTVDTSIACSGMSNRSLSPISANADKRATWSPYNTEKYYLLLGKINAFNQS